MLSLLNRRKLAQEELKQERDFIAAVIDTVASLVVVLDLKGRIVRFNRTGEKVTGYEFAEVRGKPFWDILLVPEDVEAVKAVFKQLRERKLPGEHENYLLTKDGRQRLICWNNTVLTDAQGQPAYIIGTGIDITDKKHAERELSESLNILRSVIEGTSDAIFVKDLDGRYLLINSTGASFLGKPVEEIIGKRDVELYSPETAQRFIEDDRRVISTGETQTFEGVATGPGIEQVYLVTKGVYRDSERRVIGLIGISHDITERKAAEEQRIQFIREQQARKDAETANRLKDEFLTTLSHELRTPLTSILGWSQLLNTGQLDRENSARALETIERNALAQRQLIDDLLDVSRIITGKLRLDPYPTKLAPVVESAVDAMQPTAEVKGIHVQTQIDLQDGTILGDPDRLQQIIWNLLSNAVKFTPQGGRVEVLLTRAEGSQAQIVVKDTGQGISEDFLPHVFERFRQADSSSTRTYSGLGLGLALVRHLVELHGGTVVAESEGEGRGATFTVRLPLMHHKERSSGATAGREHSMSEHFISGHRSQLEGLRVLVVDDDDDTSELIALALQKCGADVRTSDSAAKALDTLARWLPDTIISDIGMPNEDGYDLIRQVRALRSEQGGRVPALALTAYARDEDRDRALAAGFQMHLGKPVELVELVEAVTSLAARVRRA